MSSDGDEDGARTDIVSEIERFADVSQRVVEDDRRNLFRCVEVVKASHRVQGDLGKEEIAGGFVCATDVWALR